MHAHRLKAEASDACCTLTLGTMGALMKTDQKTDLLEGRARRMRNEQCIFNFQRSTLAH
jgi:hypothetical protein